MFYSGNCAGGDTKYFSCNTQDCPESDGDFRAQQCTEFNNKNFEGNYYDWVPYTKAPNPCELNCMPRGERFYYQHKKQVTDGTTCSDESNDVCVNGECQVIYLLKKIKILYYNILRACFHSLLVAT